MECVNNSGPYVLPLYKRWDQPMGATVNSASSVIHPWLFLKDGQRKFRSTFYRSKSLRESNGEFLHLNV